jgi:hypothetical protein
MTVMKMQLLRHGNDDGDGGGSVGWSDAQQMYIPSCCVYGQLTGN